MFSVFLFKPVADLLEDKIIGGKQTGGFFRVNQGIAEADLENTPARLDQDDIEIRFVPNFLRQTGGLVTITSLIAELYFNVHCLVLSKWILWIKAENLFGDAGRLGLSLDLYRHGEYQLNSVLDRIDRVDR